MNSVSGPNTRFVLTIRAAGVAAPEIASALIASGANAPPAVRATAVSGAATLRARTAAQAQHVRAGATFIITDFKGYTWNR